MAEQTVAAAPSAAEQDDVFRGETPTLDEYNQYRQSGELPARFKTTETAGTEPAESSEGEEPESAAESEAANQTQEKSQQQPKKLSAEERIAQLRATIEKLWEQDEPDTVRIAQLETTVDKIEQRSGAKRKTAPAPVAQTEPLAPQPPQYTRPKPTAEDKGPDGNAKYATYEDFVEDLADWKAEQRIVQQQRAQAAQQQERELQAKLEEARSRYDNFDEVMQPALATIVEDQKVSPTVKAMLNDSDVLPDLLFTIGSDAKALATFLQTAKTDPGKAIRYIALTENLIREELESGSKPNAEKTPPAKPQTSAPKPPSPVGGSSSRAFDVSDESLSPEEWMRKRNAQLESRRKA